MVKRLKRGAVQDPENIGVSCCGADDPHNHESHEHVTAEGLVEENNPRLNKALGAAALLSFGLGGFATYKGIEHDSMALKANSSHEIVDGVTNTMRLTAAYYLSKGKEKGANVARRVAGLGITAAGAMAGYHVYDEVYSMIEDPKSAIEVGFSASRATAVNYLGNAAMAGGLFIASAKTRFENEIKSHSLADVGESIAVIAGAINPLAGSILAADVAVKNISHGASRVRDPDQEVDNCHKGKFNEIKTFIFEKPAQKSIDAAMWAIVRTTKETPKLKGFVQKKYIKAGMIAQEAMSKTSSALEAKLQKNKTAYAVGGLATAAAGVWIANYFNSPDVVSDAQTNFDVAFSTEKSSMDLPTTQLGPGSQGGASSETSNIVESLPNSDPNTNHSSNSVMPNVEIPAENANEPAVTAEKHWTTESGGETYGPETPEDTSSKENSTDTETNTDKKEQVPDKNETSFRSEEVNTPSFDESQELEPEKITQPETEYTVEFLQPYDPLTGEGTVWNIGKNKLIELGFDYPTDSQIHIVTDATLKANGISWEQAECLQIGTRIRVPNNASLLELV